VVESLLAFLSAALALESDRGRLIKFVDSLLTFFGLFSAVLSVVAGRSTPIARLASLLRLLPGLESLTSKSSGKNAAGAL
jgi:hypothetical protein